MKKQEIFIADFTFKSGDSVVWLKSPNATKWHITVHKEETRQEYDTPLAPTMARSIHFYNKTK